MLPLEHSAILLICVKRLLVLKTNFWSFLEWPFYTGLAHNNAKHVVFQNSKNRVDLAQLASGEQADQDPHCYNVFINLMNP